MWERKAHLIPWTAQLHHPFPIKVDLPRHFYGVTRDVWLYAQPSISQHIYQPNIKQERRSTNLLHLDTHLDNHSLYSQTKPVILSRQK